MPSIDRRIVQMDFQNAQFQKGVTESLGSLKNLTSQINDASGQKLDGISDSIQEVGSKFSGLQLVAGVALGKLTSGAIDAGVKMAKGLVDPIVEGGKKRAINIEQAKFQFKALGMDVEDTMASANEAVSGTAYGLDEAAKMASIFGTSGVQAGDEMVDALKAVAGTAAMSGAGFMEVGDIFADVYGKGKAGAEDFNRLAARGVGGKQVIADYLTELKGVKVTQEEVSEMARKGQIDAEMFSAAFSEAFGESAQKANETYTGSLSNMNAALARIGELFFTQKYRAQIPVNNALAATYDTIKNALVPFAELYGKVMDKKADVMVNALTSVQNIVTALTPSFENVAKGMENLFDGFHSVLDPIKKAFKDVFFGGEADLSKSPIIGGITKITEAFAKFTDKMKLSEKGQANLTKAITVFLTPIKAAMSAISGIAAVIGGAFMTGFTAAKDILGAVGDGLKPLGDKFNGVSISVDSLKETFSNAIQPIKDFFESLSFDTSGPINSLGSFKDKVADVFKSIGSGDNKGFNDMLANISASVNSFASGPVEKLNSAISNSVAAIERWVHNDLSSWISNVSGGMTNLASSFSEWGGGKIDSIFNSASKSADGLGSSIHGVGDKAKSAGNSIKTGVGNLDPWNKLKSAVSSVGDFFSSMWNKIKDFGSGVVTMFGKAKNAVTDFLSGVDWDKVIVNVNATALVLGLAQLVKAIKNFGKSAGSFKDKIFGVVDDFTGALSKIGDSLKKFSDDTPATKLLKIAGAIALIAGAIWLLAGVDTGKMVISLGAIAAISGIFAGSMLLIGKAMAKTDPRTIGKAATSMIAMAVAIGILAIAIEKLGRLDMSTLGKGLLGVAAGIGIMIGAIYALDKIDAEESLSKMAVGIALMSGALIVLSFAIQRFGEMDLGTMIQGLIGIAAAIGIMLLAVLALSNEKMTADLYSTAIGMGLMAAALFAFSLVIEHMAQIPWDVFWDGLGKVTILLGLLMLAVLALNSTGPGMLLAAAGLTLMTIALAGMMGVIMLMSLIPWEVFMDGFAKFALLLGVVTIAVMAMSANAAGTDAAAVALLAMAVSIGVMVGAVLILGQIDMDSLLQGILAMGVLLAMLVIAANSLVGAIAGAGAMVVMAVAITILAGALWLLSGLTFGQIITGLVGIGGALLILIIAGMGAEAVAVGIGVLALGALALAAAGLLVSVALIAFAFGLGLLGPAATLAAGGLKVLAEAAMASTGAILPMVGLAAGLLLFGAGALVAGAGALILGAGLVVLGAGMVIIIASGPAAALALEQFVTQFGWGDIGKMTALAVALLPLGAALLVVGAGALVAGAGMLVVSAGMATFSSAVNALKSAIEGLVPQIEKLTAQASALTNFGSSMQKLGASLILAGGGMNAFGSSTMALGVVIKVAEVATKQFTSTMSKLPIAAIKASIGVGKALQGMSSSVKSSMTVLVGVFKAQSSIFLKQISRMATDTGTNMRKIGAAITTTVPFIVAQITVMTIAISAGLKNGLTNATKVSTTIVINMGKKIGIGLKTGLTAASKISVTIVKNMTKQISSHLTSGLSSAGSKAAAKASVLTIKLALSLSRGLSRASRTTGSQATAIGRNISIGLGNGIYRGQSYAISAAISVASRALAAARRALAVHSPSRKAAEIGNFFSLGFAKGITDEGRSATNAADGMANDVLDELAKIVEDIASSMDMVEDIVPTITPVLDLSGVNKDASMLDGMMTARTGISISSDKADSLSAQREVSETNVTNQTINNNFEFNQNNTSPKALSPNEIYRNTRKQLAIAKESLRV